MTHLESRLAGYIAAVDESSVFDTALSWVSNGDRGFLHALRRCHRLTKNASIVNHTLTAHDAVKRRCCDACFDGAISQLIPKLRELQLLMHADTRLKSLEERIDKASEITDVHKITVDLDQINLSLNAMHEAAQTSGFVNLHDKVRGAQVKVRTASRAKLDTSRDQIIALTAAQFLNNDYRRELPAEFITPEESQLLGGYERYGSSAVTRLYSTWHSTLTRSQVSPTAIQETVASFELTSPKQLAGLAFGGTTDNLEAAVTERWRDEATLVADRLIERWNARYQKLVARNEPEIVAAVTRRLPSSDLTQLILATCTKAENEQHGLVFLEVPKLVARWLERETGDDSRFGNRPKPLYRLGPVVHDGNTLDTAVRLWDLDSDTYRDPSACLAAAALLQ